jgi:hypothetical protein
MQQLQEDATLQIAIIKNLVRSFTEGLVNLEKFRYSNLLRDNRQSLIALMNMLFYRSPLSISCFRHSISSPKYSFSIIIGGSSHLYFLCASVLYAMRTS